MKVAVSKRILLLVMALSFCSGGYAQQNGSAKGSAFSPRRQLATIVFGGLGGAVLGLSTLSFYSEPEDHLDNIGTGFAAGILISAAFVTYSSLNHSAALPNKEKLAGEPELYAAKDLKAKTPFAWQWSF